MKCNYFLSAPKYDTVNTDIQVRVCVGADRQTDRQIAKSYQYNSIGIYKMPRLRMYS